MLGSMRDGARAHLGMGMLEAAHGMLMLYACGVVLLLVASVKLEVVVVIVNAHTIHVIGTPVWHPVT